EPGGSGSTMELQCPLEYRYTTPRPLMEIPTARISPLGPAAMPSSSTPSCCASVSSETSTQSPPGLRNTNGWELLNSAPNPRDAPHAQMLPSEAWVTPQSCTDSVAWPGMAAPLQAVPFQRRVTG